MTGLEKNNNIDSKKRKINEDEEELNLINYKKNNINDSLGNEAKLKIKENNETAKHEPQKIENFKKSLPEVNLNDNNDKNEIEINNSSKINKIEIEIEKNEEKEKTNNLEDFEISEKIPKNKEINNNVNKRNSLQKNIIITTENVDNKIEKENKVDAIPHSSKIKNKKSKKIMVKNINTFEEDEDGKKSNITSTITNTTTITKRKRMNADQDLITHQEIDNAENLGNINALEIIKKVIGNSEEDVELTIGTQLPVLVQPDTNSMKYQLGEIITIKKKSEIMKKNNDIDEVEFEDKKKIKRMKNKKGKSSKEDIKNNKIEIGNEDNIISKNNEKKENENNIENNEEEMKIDKNADDENMYYIHFINQDKRLDNWRHEKDLWTNKKYPEISNDASETTIRTTPYLYIPDDKAKLTRSMKRKYGIINESLQSLSEIDPKLAALEKEREEITKVKNIEKVQFGNYLLNSWYFSPYPNEYKNINKLYICDHCMKYMKYESTLIKHRKECTMLHPPGTLIYEKDKLRVYEIDGKKEKLYCQNFCLLSKLFLDHKTVYYDIEPFLFYILTEKRQENGKEIDYVMGYFSKEKKSFDDYNLACILVLPPYQRKGYGHFLIEFSYELSKRENIIGSPEKPLSDLGLVGYRTYWQSVLLRVIKNNPKMNFTLRELSLLTSIRHEDIVSTLGSMNMLKYWKGEHSLCVTPKMVEDFLSEHQNIKMEPMVDASLIHDTYISKSNSHT